jgi:hypothetical protein
MKGATFVTSLGIFLVVQGMASQECKRPGSLRSSLDQALEFEFVQDLAEDLLTQVKTIVEALERFLGGLMRRGTERQGFQEK